MDIESLKIFLDVVTLGNITKAAEHHYLTQPALSKRIIALENELGIPLFQRGKGQSKIKITQEGMAFLEIANKMSMLFDEALNIKNTSNNIFINLGCIRSAQDGFFPEIIRNLQKEAPELSISVADYHTEEIFFLLDNHRVDIGIAQSIATSQHLISDLLYQEEYKVVMLSPGTFEPGTALSPHQLPASNAIFQEFDPPFQDWFDKWWPPYAVKMFVNTTPTAVNYFSNAMDWMIVPALTAQALISKGFVAYDLSIQPPLHKVYLVYNKALMNTYLKEFIKDFKSITAKKVNNTPIIL